MHDVLGHEREGTDGVDVGEELVRYCREHLVLERVESVEDDCRGLQAVLRFFTHEVEHYAVVVRRPDVAGNVPKPDVSHARHPFDWGLECAIDCEIFIWKMYNEKLIRPT